METQRCPRCQEDLPESSFSPANRGRPGTYCKPCINTRRRELRPPLAPRPCQTCGTEYQPSRALQRFCSASCKSRDGKRRQTLGIKAAPLPPKLPPISRAGQVDNATCTHCGEPFVYVRKRRDRTLCGLCRIKRGDRRDQLRGALTVAERTQFRKAASECGICKTPKRVGDLGKGWHIDHCHTTGKVRGVLCARCNMALGLFDDDPARLEAAAAYIRRHAAS